MVLLRSSQAGGPRKERSSRRCHLQRRVVSKSVESEIIAVDTLVMLVGEALATRMRFFCDALMVFARLDAERWFSNGADGVDGG